MLQYRPASDSSNTSGNIESENERENNENISSASNSDSIFENDQDMEDITVTEDDSDVYNVPEDMNVNELVDDSDHESDIASSHSEVGVGENLTEEEKEDYIIESIRQWTLSGGVLSMRKLDELLSRLSLVLKKMPKSYKTLLSTDKKADVQDMGDHLMWYHGIKKSLDKYQLDSYLQRKDSISIDVNIDGLPLFKNSIHSKKKFWPILGRLVGTLNNPFIIAIHYGEDPRDVDLFLGDFILEIEELQNNGYSYNGVQYLFSIKHFILDAPARSLVKYCIGHGGYGACEKCTVVGTHAERRVHYANVGIDCQPRSDESYVYQVDRLHHTGHSPLELIKIGMVSQFRLDSMHLVYEGVFKRFLEVLFTWKGPWNLDIDTMQNISVTLHQLKSIFPQDFNRKPRNLEDWYKYKATELRCFLLYDAMLVLRDHLDPALYNQFLLLQYAIYILASSFCCQFSMKRQKYL